LFTLHLVDYNKSLTLAIMVKRISSILIGVILVSLFTVESCVSDKIEDPATAVKCDTISYSQDIAPLVRQFCRPCHDSASTIASEYYTYTNLKDAADNGGLRTRVLVQRDMPQNAPLPLRYRKILDCWLSAGAPNN
jgi:hypothetical protein